jgi:hypothetical protein
MQASTVQLGLIATLAVSLGYSLSSSQAIGYPAGAAVSLGSNPVRSATGHWDLAGSGNSESAVLTVPADQDLILTEVFVGLTQDNAGCWATGRFQLKDADGSVIATVPVHNSHLDYARVEPVKFAFRSGIHVPAGTVIDVEWHYVSNNCGMVSYDLSYVLSGYLATP